MRKGPSAHPAPAPWGIHWFRRDLRLGGNPALRANLRRTRGRTLGIFCLDPAILFRPDFSKNRFAFFLETLQELSKEMSEAEGDLLILEGPPEKAFDGLLEYLRREGIPAPSLWSWNRDYEPFAVSRDAAVERLLAERHGIEALTERDHLVVEPRELHKNEEPGSFYQVYSAFRKRWLSLLRTDELAERLAPDTRRAPRFSLTWHDLLEGRPVGDCPLSRYLRPARKEATVTLPPAGAQAARAALRRFGEKGLADYARNRDLPSLPGTSRLSIYLQNGSLTVAETIHALGLAPSAPGFGKLGPGPAKFLDELIWREFYYHILAHVPRVESASFLPRCSKLAWEGSQALFEAWKEGMTGFPLVDAGMRQLQQTGWMHNRLRMVTASFLCKDLLVNWQEGERYFMTQLLDGDLALNNGGWQWAASTGCDPQPYFRIFNPVLQSRRFDPDGEFIRAWVPELRSVPASDIHEPWKRGAAMGTGYPRPVVDHAAQARRAVEIYRACR